MKHGKVRGIPYRKRHKNPPKTKRYWQVFRYLVAKSVPQSPLENAIAFILTYKEVPQYARDSIVEFIAYPKARILAVRCSESEALFHARWRIAKAIGWYIYVTGIPLKTSPISTHVDEITKSNRIEALQLECPNFEHIELIPVHPTPNHVSFLFSAGGINILLDAGFSEQDAEALVEKDLIDLIVLSHAHFDHTSGIKLLYERGCKAPLVATATTLDYCTLQNDPHNSSRFDVVLKHAFPTAYGQKIPLGEKGFLQLHNAGHVPGSAMTLLDLEGFRVLYTGDFYLYDHFPTAGAASTIEALSPIHILIADASFADKKLPPDSTTYNTILETVRQSLSNGGHALISTDLGGLALSLFIQIFEFFTRLRYKAPCWLEPQILEHMRIVRTRVQDLPERIQTHIQKHRDPFSSVMRKELTTDRERTEAIGRKSIILSGPNDFSGPPVTNYLKYICNEESSIIILTGALRNQPGTQLAAGKSLITITYRPFGSKHLEETTITIKAKIFNAEHPDFVLAMHCDNPQLLWAVKQLNPQKALWFHNNPKVLEDFCTHVSREVGIESFPVKAMSIILNH